MINFDAATFGTLYTENHDKNNDPGTTEAFVNLLIKNYRKQLCQSI